MGSFGHLGEIADNHKLLDFLRYQYYRIKNYPKYYRSKKDATKREKGIEYPQFLKIKQLKNCMEGKCCFIVGTGPSITIKDIESLSGEITFGVNSICKVINQTSWRPTYLGIQDPLVYEKLEPDIIENFRDNVFVSDFLCEKFEIPERFIVFPYISVHKYYQNKYKQYGTKFSDNAYSVVYDGYSITYSMIEIAVYMGFKEIYLLGCDCSYPKGKKNHFVESGFVDRRAYLNYERMTAGYEEVKKYVDKHGIKVINCTRGGMLEIFPRMNLEEVIGG